MTRVPEVIDCWFDSGAMPFAQYHYPFENREFFHRHYPADFISEALDQTRGWFYSLLAIGTQLFDQAPFRNCIVMRKRDHIEQTFEALENLWDEYKVYDKSQDRKTDLTL